MAAVYENEHLAELMISQGTVGSDKAADCVWASGNKLNKVECMLAFHLLCMVHRASNFWRIVLLTFLRIFYSFLFVSHILQLTIDRDSYDMSEPAAV